MSPLGIEQLGEHLDSAHGLGASFWSRDAAMAEQFAGSETLNYEDESVFEALKQKTGGRGPDACIDAVGMEAHGAGFFGALDKLEQALKLETDRPTALREAIQACGKGGTVSIPGVYGGVLNHVNLGAAFGKGITFKMGQTHVHRYLERLLGHIEAGDLDPSFIITHRVPIDRAPEMYETFKQKEDACIKVVLEPGTA